MTDLQKIRDRRADLAQQRAALEKLDADLATAERVLVEMSGSEASPALNPVVPVKPPSGYGSRRERILEALSGEKVFMTSGEVNRAIAKRYGVMIKGTSLYPMLTQLKKEGVIVRAGQKGDLIAIKRRAEGASTVAN